MFKVFHFKNSSLEISFPHFYGWTNNNSSLLNIYWLQFGGRVIFSFNFLKIPQFDRFFEKIDFGMNRIRYCFNFIIGDIFWDKQ